MNLTQLDELMQITPDVHAPIESILAPRDLTDPATLLEAVNMLGVTDVKVAHHKGFVRKHDQITLPSGVRIWHSENGYIVEKGNHSHLVLTAQDAARLASAPVSTALVAVGSAVTLREAVGRRVRVEAGRVYHMKAENLLAALPDGSIDLIVTDPPYGCGSQVSARRSPDERFQEIEGVDAIDNTWLPDAYRALKVGGAAYIFAKWVNVGDWQREIESVGFTVKNCIIWDKQAHGTGDLEGSYAPQYEMILFAVKGRHILRGARPIDIIRYPKVQPANLVHPYEKPVGLLERLIRASSDFGGLVVDCFCGSGATGEAARNIGRQFIGGDISPEYVALSTKRYAQPYTPDMFAAPAA